MVIEHLFWWIGNTHIQVYLSYLGIDLVKQGEEEGVKISKEEGEDSSQLPLECDTRVIIF